MTSRALLLLSITLLLPAQPPPEPADRARQAIAGLGKEIRALLMAELAKGGFPGAVSACATRAQELTGAYSARNGFEVRRVSRKARNPKDLPDAKESAVLEQWEAASKRGEPLTDSSAVTAENGKPFLRYMKPIRVESMCLSCHDSKAQINAKVRAQIEAHFPDDAATGYQEGDLRGAFTVLMPLSSQAAVRP